MKCYGCNGVGHIRKDCPKRDGVGGRPNEGTNGVEQGVKSEATIPVRSVSDHGLNIPGLVAESPTATIMIAGEEANCILDTGAEASLMPQRYYETHLLNKIGPLEEAKEGIRVSGVSGKNIPILGFLRARVEARNHSADVGFLVVREGILTKRQEEYPIILGCNALRVLLQGGSEGIGSQGDWDLVSQTLDMPKASTMAEVAGARTVLKTQDPVVVPPFTVQKGYLSSRGDRLVAWQRGSC